MKSPDYSRRKYDPVCHTIAIITIFSFVLMFSFLYESILSSSIFHSIASTFFPDDAIVSVSEAYAQPYVETVKHRDLTIDLGNGLKTNAQLTFPAVGKGPFPGVVLLAGGGPTDMNYSLGSIHVDNKTGSKIYPPTIFFEIAEYLSERGFAVLRYDKEGSRYKSYNSG